MSMEWTPPEPTTVTPICSWSASTCTTMRPPEDDMCPALSSWIWSPEPWTPSALDLSARSSARITSSSDSQEPVTTGESKTKWMHGACAATDAPC